MSCCHVFKPVYVKQWNCRFTNACQPHGLGLTLLLRCDGSHVIRQGRKIICMEYTLKTRFFMFRVVSFRLCLNAPLYHANSPACRRTCKREIHEQIVTLHGMSMKTASRDSTPPRARPTELQNMIALSARSASSHYQWCFSNPSGLPLTKQKTSRGFWGAHAWITGTYIYSVQQHKLDSRWLWLASQQ